MCGGMCGFTLLLAPIIPHGVFITHSSDEEDNWAAPEPESKLIRKLAKLTAGRRKTEG